jgi:hypothetical protein
MDKTASRSTWAEFGPHLRSSGQQGALARPTKVQVAYFFQKFSDFREKANFKIAKPIANGV